MSAGISKDFIQGYYRSMTDKEVMYVLKQNATGLTPEALVIVKQEIERRNLDAGMFNLVQAQQETDRSAENDYDRARCPVDEPKRMWLEKSFYTLLCLFGEETILNRKVLTPAKNHFPVQYDGSEQSALETLCIVANQMEISAEKITLDFYDERLRQITEGTPGGLYWGKGEGDKFEISLARKQLDEPETMVAVLAHEIAHIKLLGENRMAESDEPITDLTTVFFGLGIFNANVAFRTFADSKYYGWSKTGYLTQMEWGYALALFAYVRQEIRPDWANYLCRNVKADFITSQQFIADNESIIFAE